ncbi:hypothetical protein QQ020_14995 [Fulvivirgaceae bacterium BMA12]|uniref:Lipoprotein n=1 Tax=Agaribacillus aureus TaxID=3051825 RepID=A0ABT8L6J3_9BACT|nr:hypothetical protein [Fulvivirgaceae bacterium BMA12]
MNKVVVFKIFIISCLCGCNAVNSQTQTPSKQEKLKSMANAYPSQEQVDPGTVKIKGTVHKIQQEASALCGRSLTNIADVRVDQLLGEGAGVVNPVSTGDTISIQFRYGFKPQKINSGEINLPGIKQGDTFIGQLREKPCFGGKGSYFEVSVYAVDP